MALNQGTTLPSVDQRPGAPSSSLRFDVPNDAAVQSAVLGGGRKVRTVAQEWGESVSRTLAPLAVILTKLPPVAQCCSSLPLSRPFDPPFFFHAIMHL